MLSGFAEDIAAAGGMTFLVSLLLAPLMLLWQCYLFLATGEWPSNNCWIINDFNQRGLDVPTCSWLPDTGWIGLDRIIFWCMYEGEPALATLAGGFFILMLSLVVAYVLSIVARVTGDAK